MAGRNRTNRFIWPLSAASALLGALVVALGARLETGSPPGLPTQPLAHLLGKPAPAFEVPGLDGDPVSPSRAAGADTWLLYFTEAGCGACEAAAPAVEEAAGLLPLIAVGTGDPDRLRARFAEVALAIGHDEEQSAHRLYGVRAMPSALLIDRGVVRHAATGSSSLPEVLAAWNDSNQGGG